MLRPGGRPGGPEGAGPERGPAKRGPAATFERRRAKCGGAAARRPAAPGRVAGAPRKRRGRSVGHRWCGRNVDAPPVNASGISGRHNVRLKRTLANRVMCFVVVDGFWLAFYLPALKMVHSAAWPIWGKAPAPLPGKSNFGKILLRISDNLSLLKS